MVKYIDVLKSDLLTGRNKRKKMRIYPAIDIRGGKCVRLRQGLFADMTVYNDDPVSVALGFKEAGAE